VLRLEEKNGKEKENSGKDILKPKTTCSTPFLGQAYLLDMHCPTAFHVEFSKYCTDLLQKDQASPSPMPQVSSHRWQKALLSLQGKNLGTPDSESACWGEF